MMMGRGVAVKAVKLGVLAAILLADSVAAAESSKCTKLLDDFDMAEREIARLSASGFGDDSAPRESNRQLRIVTQSLNKSMTLQLILANKCAGLPERADGSGEYSFSAMRCRTEHIKLGSTKGDFAKECSVRDWRKNKDMPPVQLDRSPEVPMIPGGQCQMPPCYAPLESK